MVVACACAALFGAAFSMQKLIVFNIIEVYSYISTER
jgi:presenilin-like A22 family membrane protease